jgi:geranylgeranyl reductase family protein
MPSEAEVGVVGAGPGGSACAAALAARGYDVALVDKDEFPRDKACGDGLSPLAVELLEELGLGPFLATAQPIRGYRIVFDHRRERQLRFPGGRLARCVGRIELDAALRDVAIERGARFVRARARGIELAGESARLDLAPPGAAAGGGEELAVRRAVAADGATSGVRKQAGLAHPERSTRAWAVRAYFATERPLEEFFDVFVPLEVEGQMLNGYGWVFPVGERVANVGIGFSRSLVGGARVPFDRAFAAFVEELRLREGRRLGDLEPLGKPIGAPISSQFAAQRAAGGPLLFVGDAAGTTDPFTGEGITAALHSGLIAAEHVDRSLARGAPLGSYGAELGRRLPRIGQDLSVVVHSLWRLGGIPELARGRGRDLDFLLSSPINPEAEALTTFEGSVAGLLARSSPADAQRLAALHAELLDSLDSAFPLAKPVIAEEVEAGGGPVYAASLLCAGRACGGEADRRAALGGRAAECLGAFSVLLSRLNDRPGRQIEKLNNALAVLAADHAVSRSLLAVAEIGPAAATAFARTSQRVCGGGMTEIADRFHLARSTERYLGSLELRVGSIFSFAASLGAELAGADPERVECLGRYGRLLGVAYGLAEDLRELEAAGEDEEGGRELASSLAGGRYGLPLLLAMREDPRLKRQVVAGPTRHELADLLALLRAGSAVPRTREILADCAGSARAALHEADPVDPAGLESLVSWVEARAGGPVALSA